MEVHVEEIESTLRAYDPEAMLTPRTMAKIVQAVVATLEERDEHRERAGAETQIDTGLLNP